MQLKRPAVCESNDPAKANGQKVNLISISVIIWDSREINK